MNMDMNQETNIENKVKNYRYFKVIEVNGKKYNDKSRYRMKLEIEIFGKKYNVKNSPLVNTPASLSKKIFKNLSKINKDIVSFVIMEENNIDVNNKHFIIKYNCLDKNHFISKCSREYINYNLSKM